jgi:hypothetical protein
MDFGATDGARALHVESAGDGSFLVAGKSGGDFAVVRYGPGGARDTSRSRPEQRQRPHRRLDVAAPPTRCGR